VLEVVFLTHIPNIIIIIIIIIINIMKIIETGTILVSKMSFQKSCLQYCRKKLQQEKF
jgi:hypothetical protein